MIYDCFTFFNELEILDIRLEELYPVVDKFVIVEADHTFQGQQKPQFGFNNLERYEKYNDKIIWCNLNFNTVKRRYRNAWDREYTQRNSIKQFLERQEMQDDDIILISDADEIPRRSVVRELNPDPIQSIGLDVYYYSLNVNSGQEHTIRAVRWSELKNTTPQKVRTLDPPPNIIHGGGWHFSYLGSPEHIVDKFKAFAHSELNRPDTTNVEVINNRMAAGVDLWGGGTKYHALPIDDTWPEAIKNNREYWEKYVY